MSYVYRDGRGGSREGAGRPKSTEPKKAFRITDEERELIKKIRLLDDTGLDVLKSSFSKIIKKHTKQFWW